MEDRLKFRAWYHDDYSNDDDNDKMFYDAQDTYDCLGGNPPICASSFGCIVDDEKWTVEQCTGLKDKNGKLIYEGDIVKGKATTDEGGFEYLGCIQWYYQSEFIGWYIEDKDGRGWELKQAHAKISMDNITGEIIGNIHENPELLEYNKDE